MSQSRFSIVLVGVSALLRRPLVSRLRPAAFTARCSGGFCRSALPSVSEIAAWRVDASARRVGLRVRSFRFSARAASGLPLVGLAFGLTASAFRHAPLRGYPRRVGSSAFRFGVCHSAGWPSGSPLPLFGMRRSAPPHRRSEGRRSTPTRHLFHFKTLIPTC